MPYLPIPNPANIFVEDGQAYVTSRSGPIPIDEWRIIQYLYKATDDELIEWAKKVCPMGPNNYQFEMDLYGEPETHTGYVAYIRRMNARWHEVDLTVQHLEVLP